MVILFVYIIFLINASNNLRGGKVTRKMVSVNTLKAAMDKYMLDKFQIPLMFH